MAMASGGAAPSFSEAEPEGKKTSVDQTHSKHPMLTPTEATLIGGRRHDRTAGGANLAWGVSQMAMLEDRRRLSSGAAGDGGSGGGGDDSGESSSSVSPAAVAPDWSMLPGPPPILGYTPTRPSAVLDVSGPIPCAADDGPTTNNANDGGACDDKGMTSWAVQQPQAVTTGRRTVSLAVEPQEPAPAYRRSQSAKRRSRPPPPSTIKPRETNKGAGNMPSAIAASTSLSADSRKRKLPLASPNNMKADSDLLHRRGWFDNVCIVSEPDEVLTPPHFIACTHTHTHTHTT